VAAGVLILFALSGQWIFRMLGITLPAFQIAGSVLLLRIAMDMLYAKRSGAQETREETEAGETGLMLGAARDHAAADHFTDEHALAVRTDRGLAVLVGCSHRGLVNSILSAKAAASDGAVDIVFGGAHLRSASDAHIDWAARRAHQLTAQVALGHCTGKDAELQFAQIFVDRFHRLRSGWRWQDGPSARA